MTEFKDGEIEGVLCKELNFFSDERGWLTEIFRNDEINEQLFPSMCYVSMTKPGKSRGPHAHERQTDYFAFLSSSFRIQLWDSRTDSATYRNKKIINAGKENPVCIIIPPGVVHGYRNVGDEDGTVLNFPNSLYKGAMKKHAVDEIRFENDPDSPYKMD